MMTVAHTNLTGILTHEGVTVQLVLLDIVKGMMENDNNGRWKYYFHYSQPSVS